MLVWNERECRTLLTFDVETYVSSHSRKRLVIVGCRPFFDNVSSRTQLEKKESNQKTLGTCRVFWKSNVCCWRLSISGAAGNDFRWVSQLAYFLKQENHTKNAWMM